MDQPLLRSALRPHVSSRPCHFGVRQGPSSGASAGRWREQGAACSACGVLLAARHGRNARNARSRVAKAAAVISVEEEKEEEETEEDERPLESLKASIKAKVARRVGDVVIVITEPIGEEDTNRLPSVGDTVRFSSGALAYVVALGDLCYAGVLVNPAEEVEEGDSYEILSRANMPRIRLPRKDGCQLLDIRGQELGTEVSSDEELKSEDVVPLFNEIVGIVRRQRIDSPLHSGVIGLDAFVPIGRGQSMLLRLPSGLSQKQLYEYIAHVIKAQKKNNVKIFTAAPSAVEAAEIKSLLGESDVVDRLTVISGGMEARPGEAVLAENGACALAEAARDAGEDALLLLDLEQLFKVWNLLAEVSSAEHLTEIADTNLKKEINGLTQDLGIELWKYVARKNAASGRRRTFLGCFLQRAGRMSEERGGGSLTLLAFARLKDTSMLSRLELEAKLRNLMDMELDEGVRARAVEKVQRQLAELAEDDMGSGVPDDFLEESKAVTDGHVVFLDDAIDKEGQATWAIDIQESVARGITANSIQNRYLDMLESLKLKAFLMNAEKESQVMDNEDMDVKLDNAPLRALMQQSVGDVMTPEDEAILLLLAEEAAARAAASRPLAEHVVNLTKQARIRQDDVKERRRRVALLRRWVEATWDDKTNDIEALVAKHAEELADVLELKPLERKRLLAVIEEGVSQEVPTETEESLLAEDAQVRYEHLHSLLESLRKELTPGMDVTNAEAEDIALFLGYLRAKSREALSPQ